MSTAPNRRPPNRDEPRLPPLENGDRLDQKTFHARYEAMPSHVRAELIGGIVYMASPSSFAHGISMPKLVRWLSEYEDETPGTAAFVHTTSILGPHSELQPDATLSILPECGGQTWEDDDEYMRGAPELVVEVSFSTESIDLNSKLLDYEQAGVREYIVLALQAERVFWYVRKRNKFRELAPDDDGIHRSEVFPGLWLDAAALLRKDRKRLLAVLRQGLASPEHAAFVAKLAAKRG